MIKTIKYIIILIFSIQTAAVAGQDADDIKRRQVILESLSHYNYCRVLGCSNGLPYPNDIPLVRKYYNDSLKAKILFLLKDRWANNELENLALLSVEKQLALEIDLLSKSRENPNLSSRQRKSLVKRLDSLMTIHNQPKDTVVKYQQAIKKKRQQISLLKTENHLIKIAGIVDDTVFSPVLERALKDTILYDQHTLKLALGRLGSPLHEKEMLKFYSYDGGFIHRNRDDHLVLSEYYRNKSDGLLYLSTQASILELSKFLSVERKNYKHKSHDVIDYPVYKVCVADLIGKIENPDFKEFFKKQLPSSYGYIESVISERHIEFIESWFKTNYGSYIIKRD